jgi:glucose-1-phosphate thymidylyltransferase
MAVIGVIPAAGYATRLQGSPYAVKPAADDLSQAGVFSKEALEIRGRPVMAHLVERMRAAGCDEVRVVTRPEKRDVITYANDAGLTVVTGRPEHVVASVSLALARPSEIDGDDVVLLGFPDTVWQPENGFALLLRESTARGADVVLGLFGSDEAARGDVVRLATDDAVARVAAIDVKPARPASRLIWGCAVARRRALVGWEIEAEPGRWFARLAPAGRVWGAYLSDDFVDIGTLEALARERES